MSIVEYLPVGQLEHAADPATFLYFPTPQPMQLPFGPDQPALQTQDVMSALPTKEFAFTHSRHSVRVPAEYEPAAQSVHVDALTTFEYFPPAHAVQPFWV